MKIYCCCCARQIVTLVWDREIMTEGPITYMGPDKACCSECSEALDENGLFPEERGAAMAFHNSIGD